MFGLAIFFLHITETFHLEQIAAQNRRRGEGWHINACRATRQKKVNHPQESGEFFPVLSPSLQVVVSATFWSEDSVGVLIHQFLRKPCEGQCRKIDEMFRFKSFS